MGSEIVFTVIFTISCLILLISASLVYVGMMHRSEGECLALLKVWMEENGMILLSQHLCFFFPSIGPISDGDYTSTGHVLYWVNTEDLQGHRRAGLASISGRDACNGAFIPRSVAVCWWRLRTVAKGAFRPKGKPLWDDWVDG